MSRKNQTDTREDPYVPSEIFLGMHENQINMVHIQKDFDFTTGQKGTEGNYQCYHSDYWNEVAEG